MLPPEFVSVELTLLKVEPEQLFCRGGIIAEMLASGYELCELTQVGVSLM